MIFGTILAIYLRRWARAILSSLLLHKQANYVWTNGAKITILPVRRAWRCYKFAVLCFVFRRRKLAYCSWVLPFALLGDSGGK